MTQTEIEQHNRMVAIAHAIVEANNARGSDLKIAIRFGVSRRHVNRLRNNLLVKEGRLYRKVRKGVLPLFEVTYRDSHAISG